MELRPEGNKVVVRPDTAETITKGGIIIPPAAREQQQTAANRGEIVAIGPDASLHCCPDADGIEKQPMKPGDRVLFARYGGSVVRVDTENGREEYRILYDADIICRITGEGNPDLPPPRKSMVK